MSAQDDMVERVARAVCGRNCDMPECSCQPDADSKAMCRAMSIAMAVRAIAAMREPTRTMVIGALSAAIDWMKANGVDGLSPFADYPSPAETTRVCHRAMIDAALTHHRDAAAHIKQEGT